MKASTVSSSGGVGSAGVDRLLVWLLAVCFVGAVAQITLGGVVRVTGSGDGCPDWPLCYGGVLPPLEKHALIEWSHRTSGLVVGLVLLAAAVRVWLRGVGSRGFTTAALLLIAVVGGIGGAVVLSDLDPALRTLHLVLAEMVVFLTGFAFASAAWPGGSGSGGLVWGSNHVKIVAWACAAALVAILSGSDIVWRGAGAVCPSWPLCGGSVVPQSNLAWMHMSHRIVSLLVGLVIFAASLRVLRGGASFSAVRWAAAAGAALLLAQMFVGAANPWTGFDEWSRALHLSLATLLWADLVLLLALLLRPWAWPVGRVVG